MTAESAWHHADVIVFEYYPGQRLERTAGDDLISGAVVLHDDGDSGEAACVILPPSWASDRLVDLLSWRAEAMVLGTCPRCRERTFVLDERDPLIPPLPSLGDLRVPTVLVHGEGCPVDDRTIVPLLRADLGHFPGER